MMNDLMMNGLMMNLMVLKHLAAFVTLLSWLKPTAIDFQHSLFHWLKPNAIDFQH